MTPLLIDEGMAAMCCIAASAKGWTVQEAARRTLANFNDFFGVSV